MAQNIVIELNANYKQFESALDAMTAKVESTASKMDKAFSFGGDAAKQIKNTSNAVNELHLGLKNISVIAAGEILAKGFEKAFASIKNLGSEIYNTTRDMQSMQMSMKSLVSSDLVKTGKVKDYTEATQKAEAETEKLLGWFKELSLKSPYELIEVMDAFKMNANMGQTVDVAKKTTEAILALGAGLGMGQAEMKRFSAALAQTGSTGKITATDMRQFANNGFGMDKMSDIFARLSEKYKIVIKDHNDFNKAVEQGKITTDDFFDAIHEFAMENYGGAVDAMASTIGGLISSMKDIKTNVINDLFLEASKTISSTLAPYVEYLMKLLTSGDFTKWGKEINKWVTKTIAPLQKIGETLENGVMGRAIRNLKDFFSGKTVNVSSLKYMLEQVGGEEFAEKWISRLDIIKGYIDKFMEHKDTIIAAIKGIGVAFATAFAVNKVADFLKAITGINPSLLALTAIGAAVGIAWEKNLFGFQDKVKSAVESAKNYFGELKNVYDEKGLSGVWEKLRTDAENAISKIPGKFDEALNTIGTYINTHKDAWFATAKEKTLDAVEYLFGPDAEQDVRTFFETTIPSTFQSLETKFEPIKNMFSETFGETKNGVIKEFQETITKIEQTFSKDTWQRFGNTLKEVGTTLVGILLVLGDMALGSIDNLVQGIGDGLNNILSIGQNLATTLSDLWDLIKAIATGDWDTAGIKLSDLGTSLENLGQSIVDAVRDGIQNAIDAIVNMFFDAYIGTMGLLGQTGKVAEMEATKKRYNDKREAERNGVAYVDPTEFLAFDNAFWKEIEDGLDTSMMHYIRGQELSGNKVSNELLEWLINERSGKDPRYEGIEDFYKNRFLDNFLPQFEESGQTWLEFAKQMDLTTQQQAILEEARAEVYDKEFEHWFNNPKSVGNMVDSGLLSDFYKSAKFTDYEDYESYKRAAFDYAYEGMFSSVEKAVETVTETATETVADTAEEVAQVVEDASQKVSESVSTLDVDTSKAEEYVQKYFSSEAEAVVDGIEEEVRKSIPKMKAATKEVIDEAVSTVEESSDTITNRNNGMEYFHDEAEGLVEEVDRLAHRMDGAVSDIRKGRVYFIDEAEGIVEEVDRLASRMDGAGSTYQYAFKSFNELAKQVEELSKADFTSAFSENAVSEDDLNYFKDLLNSSLSSDLSNEQNLADLKASVSYYLEHSADLPQEIKDQFLPIFSSGFTNLEIAQDSLQVLVDAMEKNADGIASAITGGTSATADKNSTASRLAYGDVVREKYLSVNADGAIEFDWSGLSEFITANGLQTMNSQEFLDYIFGTSANSGEKGFINSELQAAQKQWYDEMLASVKAQEVEVIIPPEKAAEIIDAIVPVVPEEGEEGEGIGTGGILEALFGNPEMYQGLADVLTPEVMTSLQTLIATEIDAETWTLFADAVEKVATGFTTLGTALGGGEEGSGLSAMFQSVLDGATGLNDYFNSDFIPTITNVANALAVTSTDSEGNISAGDGNTLYTAMGVIQGLIEDIRFVTENLVAYWNGEFFAAIVKLQMETTPIAVRSLQKIKKSVSSLGDAIYKVNTLLGEMIGLLEGMDGLNVPTVGSGTSNSDTGSTGSKKPTKQRATGLQRAGGGSIFPYSTAIVGEHGPEIIRTGSSRLNVFANTQLMDEIAHTRHALNMLSSSAEAVYTNRMIAGMGNTYSDNHSQNFNASFGTVVGDKAFEEMMEDKMRKFWRREMRLAS